MSAYTAATATAIAPYAYGAPPSHAAPYGCHGGGKQRRQQSGYRLFIARLAPHTTIFSIRQYFTTLLETSGHHSAKRVIQDVYLPLNAFRKTRGFAFLSLRDYDAYTMV